MRIHLRSSFLLFNSLTFPLRLFPFSGIFDFASLRLERSEREIQIIYPTGFLNRLRKGITALICQALPLRKWCNSGLEILKYTNMVGVMLLPRTILPELKQLLAEYPVVTVLGPRQAGKTTLVRKFLRNYGYVNLEDPGTREIATVDPKAFLAGLESKTIIDEIQRVPELLSYLQVDVDERGENGCYVLTGSHQLSLRGAVSQSLAGRTALLHLLPFSLAELHEGGIGFYDFEDYAFTGFLPRVHEQSQRPAVAYANYFQTYVERDVRQLIQLKDATLFEKALKLLAGRTGQVIDYSSLGNDVGVDAKTIRNWISILEASFILFKLPPYFENFGKRIVKSPKYYFTEVGLLCHLLGIREPAQITRDPLVGGIFENLVVIECAKALFNRGLPAELYYFRDAKGNEVDLLVPVGRGLKAVEIKSAATFKMDRLLGLRRFRSLAPNLQASYLIYNGEGRDLSDATKVVNFRELESIFDDPDRPLGDSGFSGQPQQ